MKHKVVMALVDGMRPDGIVACGHPFFEQLKQESTYCLTAQTITRPITLPAHISLFTGVDQLHHENYDNDWHPYPKPYPGILETVHDAGGKTAMLITWEPLQFLGRRDSIDRLDFLRGDVEYSSYEDAFRFEYDWAERAVKIIRSNEYDFVFFYFEMADVIGHLEGWMSDPYLKALHCAGDCLAMLFEALQPDQQMIVLSDHGGFEKKHNDPENPYVMTIPIYCYGSMFQKNCEQDGWHILDIAPTVSKILQVEVQPHYQGKPLL
ncbi:MAG: alkaline phosphatase family protein [Oscillospiraceae bacterium]|jgi:predicted AlkP superfamily pyrophosphatase or phosphodiesterase